LRNPLAGIELWAAVLETSSAAGEETTRIAGRISETTRYMNRLIQDLVDVVRLESRKLSLVPARHSVNELVERAVEATRQLKLSTGIETSIPSGLPLVDVDGDRVVQVLSNLLGNALKFTPENGRVRIAARRCDEGVEIAVTDNGCGMPPEQVAHVFDRFWQASRSDRRGLGLGLAIAKGIVEQQGGRIWVESEPSRGTSFYFTLPARVDSVRHSA
jgi:signal transduction histidine kinase